MRVGLPLMKNILKPLTKSFLIPLGLIAAKSAAGLGIQKKMIGLGRLGMLDSLPLDLAQRTTTFTISNEEMKDIMKKVKSFEEPGVLIKGVSETTEKE